MNLIDKWAAALAEEDSATKEQVERDIESGRLSILSGDGDATCQEVDAMRTAPNCRCHRPAVVFDSQRQRNQCQGHALTGASGRGRGRREYPLLDA